MLEAITFFINFVVLIMIFLRKQDRWILYFLWHNTHFNNNQYVNSNYLLLLMNRRKNPWKKKKAHKILSVYRVSNRYRPKVDPQFSYFEKKYAFVEPTLKLLVVFAHAVKRCCRRISFHTVSFWAKTYFPTIRYCMWLRDSPSILYFQRPF